jgi:hypothetical protein
MKNSSIIPEALARSLEEYAAARRESTAAWGRGIHGREWLAIVQAEKFALARFADAALAWSDQQLVATSAENGGPA